MIENELVKCQLVETEGYKLIEEADRLSIIKPSVLAYAPDSYHILISDKEKSCFSCPNYSACQPTTKLDPDHPNILKMLNKIESRPNQKQYLIKIARYFTEKIKYTPSQNVNYSGWLPLSVFKSDT